MSRTQRLLELLQILRNHRFPVAGEQLSAALGISLRSLYRDIATLQAQGAPIEGEMGRGYVLKPGFTLPPLMLTNDEIEALVLGSRWVASRGDSPLAQSAQQAISKIAAVLPDPLRDAIDATTLLIGSCAPAPPAQQVSLSELRNAIHNELKLQIDYLDLKEQTSQRIVWPFALGFFEHVHVLIAWCELRKNFRHFRTDRIQSVQPLQLRYPRSRTSLLDAWRTLENIPRPNETR